MLSSIGPHYDGEWKNPLSCSLRCVPLRMHSHKQGTNVSFVQGEAHALNSRAVSQVEEPLSPARDRNISQFAGMASFNFGSLSSCLCYGSLLKTILFSLSCCWVGMLYWVLWLITRAAMEDVCWTCEEFWWQDWVFPYQPRCKSNQDSLLFSIDLPFYQCWDE